MTNLREFLESRERELVTEINSSHSRLSALEAELAEVRRAKAALRITSKAAVGYEGAARVEGSTQVPHPASWQNNSHDVAARTAIEEHRHRQRAAIVSGVYDPPLPLRVSASPYQNLTMKQLVVKVLHEHFPNGATARQMLEFFRDAWGRNIERHNLSPQLSRLFQDRIIGRRDDHCWFLRNAFVVLRRGAIFRADFDGVAVTALKIFLADTEAAVVLTPNRGDWPVGKIVYYGEFTLNAVELPGVALVANEKEGVEQGGPGIFAEPLDVELRGNERFLIVKTIEGNRRVNLSTGEVTTSRETPRPSKIYTQWALIEESNRAHQVLYEHKNAQRVASPNSISN